MEKGCGPVDVDARDRAQAARTAHHDAEVLITQFEGTLRRCADDFDKIRGLFRQWQRDVEIGVRAEKCAVVAAAAIVILGPRGCGFEISDGWWQERRPRRR